jgi:hypothetical protein
MPYTWPVSSTTIFISSTIFLILPSDIDGDDADDVTTDTIRAGDKKHVTNT